MFEENIEIFIQSGIRTLAFRLCLVHHAFLKCYRQQLLCRDLLTLSHGYFFLLFSPSSSLWKNAFLDDERKIFLSAYHITYVCLDNCILVILSFIFIIQNEAMNKNKKLINTRYSSLSNLWVATLWFHIVNVSFYQKPFKLMDDIRLSTSCREEQVLPEQFNLEISTIWLWYFFDDLNERDWNRCTLLVYLIL